MKYLKLFKTETDRDTFLGGGDLILPNVSVIEGKKDVVYKPKKKMITFTVGNNDVGYSTYNAEEGMTFADFVNSQYNDGTISLSLDTVVWEHDSIPHTIINVISTTVIVNGKGYGIQISGGA